MKIRVLTAKPGHPAGSVIDVDGAEAKRWLDAGEGEKVVGGKAVETASAEPVGAEVR